ncbi:chloride channel CLIC-like protein 1 isoform X2 [Eleutherodactylus coqui]|uniref:Chloride channel CLIC-like protein 1 n=1 Tax=Eleutherodactylus coqui TaxID=57060 RepID=A0A8J6F9K0_ELECQ|nr:hypothetical protein GDO78_009317 [Eleutherodactylus coqui]
MLALLLLSLCATLCCGRYDDDEWTDPTDMFNYDAATGKMIKQKHNMEEQVEGVCEKGEEACLGNNNKAIVLDTKKSKQMTEEPKHKEDLKSLESNSNPVFRRFLRKVLNEAERFGLPEDSSSEVYYNAEMVLSKQMVVEIQKFLDDEDWNLGAFEEALTRTLVQFRSHNVKEWWTGIFEDHLGIDLGTAFKILLCIACIVSILATELWSRIGWFTQLKRLCIVSFIISVAWNWMYLYKVAFAERQAELAKMHKFRSCGEKMSWSDSLIDWWKGASTFQNDPCEEYFKSLMINPALMVPPTKALALTFTDFITEPLKHVGKALGEFLNGLLAEIPVFYQLLVLILIAAILMVSCYGASSTIGHVLTHRNHRDPPQDRLPPAVPQGPPYGNVIEGGQQPPYYYRLEDIPHHRYPQNQRPENLQAMDVLEDRRNAHLAGFTDVDSGSKAKESEQEPRKEVFTEQSGETAAQPGEASQAGKEQEKSHRPQQREKEPVQETSPAHLRIEQKSYTKYQHNPDSIEEMTNSTQQSKAEPLHERSQPEGIDQEPEAHKGEHQNKEPLLDGSCQRQRVENSVEDISHGEPSWKEETPDDKVSTPKEIKSHCQPKETSPEEQQLHMDTV